MPTGRVCGVRALFGAELRAGGTVGYALVACVVVPGFALEDFELPLARGAGTEVLAAIERLARTDKNIFHMFPTKGLTPFTRHRSWRESARAPRWPPRSEQLRQSSAL